MKTFKTIFDFITGRRTALKNNIDGTSVYVLDRIHDVSSWKAKTFFHHSIVSSVTDAYEYFLNVDTDNNIFYKNIQALSPKTGESFLKWESVYHTLCFTKMLYEAESDEGSLSLNTQELEYGLFYIFEFNDEERRQYYEFKEQLLENETEFTIRFAGASISDIFDISEMSSVETSFVYNFYYNCYNEFYSSYIKYEPIKLIQFCG